MPGSDGMDEETRRKSGGGDRWKQRHRAGDGQAPAGRRDAPGGPGTKFGRARETDAPSFKKGSAFWMVKYAPLMLMSNCSSYALSVVSAKGAKVTIPAFTNNTSILPSVCETSAYSLSTSVSLATSACTATTPFPIVLTASSSVFLLRPEMATLAPSSCKRLAVASPMPLLPPVTTATFPSSLFMSVSLSLPDFLLGPLPGGIHADPPGASKIWIFR